MTIKENFEYIEGLIEYFIEIEFYDSALLLSQYLFSINKTKKSVYLVLFTHYKKKNVHKMKKIHERNLVLCQTRETEMLCIKAGILKSNNTTHYNSEDNTACTFLDFQKEKRKMFCISYDSIVLFFEGCNNTEQTRSEMLKMSLKIDKNNTESIFMLFKNNQITYKEFIFIINSIEDSVIKQVFTDIFMNQVKIDNYFTDVYMQIFTHLKSVEFIGHYTEDEYDKNNENCNNCNLENNKNFFRFDTKMFLNEMFKFSAMEISAIKDVENGNCIKNDEYVSFIFGLYYLSKKSYRDDKKSFTKSTALNPDFGYGYMYLGISCSLLREIDSSFNALNKANAICDNALSLFYLAQEYKLISNTVKAKYYYLQCVNADNMFIHYYAFLLLSIDEYGKEEKYIKHDLLKVIHCIMKNNLTKAHRILSSDKVNDILSANHLEEYGHKNIFNLGAYYYLLRGYVFHLREEFDKAIENYLACKNAISLTVCDTLLDLAYEARIFSERDFKIPSYLYCVLDALPFSKKPKNIFI